MPIEVQFDRNIGLKKNTVDTGLGVYRSTQIRAATDRHSTSSSQYSKRPSSKDLKAQMIDKRKKIQSSYTRVDPSIQEKVKQEIIKRVDSKKQPKDHWEPNKYVIEQIRKKAGSPGQVQLKTRYMATVDTSSDRYARQRGTGTTSKGSTSRYINGINAAASHLSG